MSVDCVEAKLSGYTTDGTFAQYVVSFVNHVSPIPDGLDSAGAASILCAGVTVYKALKNANTTPGDWIAIPGAGGGLGHLAVQYAKDMGLNVIAIDTGAAKKELVTKLGAAAWIDFKESKDLVAAIKKATPDGLGPQSAIVVASHESAYTQAVDYLRPSGTLVPVGLPNAPLSANVFWTVFKSIRIQVSYVGNRQDAVEALAIAAKGKVKVVFEEKQLKDLKECVPSSIIVSYSRTDQWMQCLRRHGGRQGCRSYRFGDVNYPSFYPSIHPSLFPFLSVCIFLFFSQLRKGRYCIRKL